MGGKKRWELPEIGRVHEIKVDGEMWEIRPPFDKVMMVAHVSEELGVAPGVEIPFDKLAKLKRASVDNLLDAEQLAAFNSWGPQRQAIMAEKLFRVWKEIWSGKEELNPDEQPIEPLEPVTEVAKRGPDPTPSPSA